MIALIALLVGLAVLAGYLALSERLEAGTLPRRQVDAWAIVLAVICLAGIGWSGFQARLAGEAAAQLAYAPLPAWPTPVRRLQMPDLTIDHGRWWPQAAAPTSAVGALRSLALGSVDEEPLPPAGVGSGGGDDARSEGQSASDAAQAPEFVVVVTEPPLSEPVTALPLPTSTRPPPLPATATPRPVMWPTATPWIVPTDARQRPTLFFATAEPRPLATRTPHCGSPERIELRVKSIAAEVDCTAGQMVVHYLVRVRNDSGFPATVAEVMVTAVNRSGASEQYGSVRLPDVTLEPGATIDLDGALTLVKAPGPFGTTDLCISFVGESCGQRAPYRVVRQCARVGGL